MTCPLSPDCPYCDAPEPKCSACDDMGCQECCETEPVTLEDLEEMDAEEQLCERHGCGAPAAGDYEGKVFCESCLSEIPDYEWTERRKP